MLICCYVLLKILATVFPNVDMHLQINHPTMQSHPSPPLLTRPHPSPPPLSLSLPLTTVGVLCAAQRWRVGHRPSQYAQPSAPGPARPSQHARPCEPGPARPAHVAIRATRSPWPCSRRPLHAAASSIARLRFNYASNRGGVT